MHSFALLALASSALAFPVSGPRDLAHALAVAPIKADALNPNIDYVNIANDAFNNNDIAKRDDGYTGYDTDDYGDDNYRYSSGYRTRNVADVNAIAPVHIDAVNPDISDVSAANNAVNQNKIARDGSGLADVTAIAPAYVDAANPYIKDVTVLDNSANGNKVLARHDSALAVVNAIAPVKADVLNPYINDVNVADKSFNNNKIARDNSLLADVDAIIPADVSILNPYIKDVNVLDGSLNNNRILSRAPTSVPVLLANAQVQVNAIVAKIQLALTSDTTPTYDSLNPHFIEVNVALEALVSELIALIGVNADVLVGGDGVDVKIEVVAQVVAELLNTVAQVLVDVQKLLGSANVDVYVLLGGTCGSLLKVIVDLCVGINVYLSVDIKAVVELLASVGININVAAAGL